MEIFDNSGMLDQVPIIHIRGTNYQVGLGIGRTFKGMIQELYTSWDFFNNSILPNYTTLEGKQIYDDVLCGCEIKFPRYVEELRGLAEGAGVPFYKVFMMHIDSLATPASESIRKIQADSGCTSILCNREEIILAQNEDGYPESLNRFYVVSAEILDDDGNKLEKFTALTYAGLLSGWSMGYNEHGIVFTVNTLVAKDRLVEGTPRWVLTRALLAAKNHKEILEILADEGTGVADGFNVNICYTDRRNNSGSSDMYTIEVAPPKRNEQKSQISVLAVPRGESYVHCNRYLHLKVAEEEHLLTSTIHRHAAISRLPSPSTMELVKNVMSDQSDIDYPVFRRFQTEDRDKAKTVATGIFDIGERKFAIYVNPPSRSQATAVIPMDI